ncbi:MAG: helix-turn-helix transcriptional regulator [Bacillota bacterium]|nr:helix-turn-helix transcriptional regulator [Bacillota bacterium]
MEIKVGEIIKAKRIEKGYGLVEFAKSTGISPGYLSQLENGRKTNPNLEVLMKISSELEIDIDMLLGITNSNENLNLKIPSLLKLVLAKDRNIRVMEDKEVLKKFCNIVEKMLESKYLIEEDELYKLFLEDIYIQIETVLKRYMAFQIINSSFSL